jgi:hypothetical protein
VSLKRREAGALKLGTFVSWRPSERKWVQGDVSLARTAEKLAEGDETYTTAPRSDGAASRQASKSPNRTKKGERQLIVN